jgi:hypothetical protein
MEKELQGAMLNHIFDFTEELKKIRFNPTNL